MLNPVTIKVKSDTELGYRIINVEDFDPKTDVKFEDEIVIPKVRKPKL